MISTSGSMYYIFQLYNVLWYVIQTRLCNTDVWNSQWVVVVKLTIESYGDMFMSIEPDILAIVTLNCVFDQLIVVDTFYCCNKITCIMHIVTCKMCCSYNYM